jgi:hypothetical protein
VSAYGLLMGNTQGKRPLGRPKRRLMDNIKLNLGDIGWGSADLTGLAQDRERCRVLVNAVITLRAA